MCVRGGGGGNLSDRVYVHVVKLMGGLCPRIQIRAKGGGDCSGDIVLH